MSTDTLSELLRAVRLSGAIFFTIDASEPRVIEVPSGPELAPYLMRGVEHVIEYHVIAAGTSRAFNPPLATLPALCTCLAGRTTACSSSSSSSHSPSRPRRAPAAKGFWPGAA